MTQVKLWIDTTFVDTKSVAKVIKYLTARKILRDGIEIALSNYYGALASANEGMSLKEVEFLVEEARTQFELCQSLALTIAKGNVDQKVEPINSKGELKYRREKKQVGQSISFDNEEL